MSKFHKLKVLEVKKETNDSVSVSFDVPYELYETFNFKAGQYVTLKFVINGEEARRSYSLCSSPVLEKPLKVGVKRVKKGLVSNYINDNLKSGDIVEVMVPDGRFFADVQKENYKTYYLFAAGSGITPILSILRTVLLTEEKSYVNMIYGNRNQETIMFKEELEALKKEFPERFALVYTLSKPKSSFWSSKNKMDHRKGRVDKTAIEWFINEFPPYAQNAEYFICGPGTMIENTQKVLQSMDVPDTRIFIESFGGGTSEETTEVIDNANLTASLDGEEINIHIPKGKTILRAMLDNNYDPPYSCEGGVCSSCMCKLNKGEVFMKKNLALSDADVKDGYILSCQSVPLTEEVAIVFE
ncbi:ferredoxin--NADP reductase [uncultured Tenacibaculum sp.]|uniref:ferredoxin--NADP reductase n=1 Tax=uncultured Tenacibaculum sp. TaxID=174713 RepID=UPI00261CDE2B|nr:ferredoxin--NADP reductase [uncultured Tenacibaculum sp.]